MPPPPGQCLVPVGLAPAIPGRRGDRAAVPLPPPAPARTRHPPLPPSWAPRAAASSERPLGGVSAARRPPPHLGPPAAPAGIPAPSPASGPRAGTGVRGSAGKQAASSRRGSAAGHPPDSPHTPGPSRCPAPTCRARGGNGRSPCAGGASVTRFVVATEALPTSPPTSPGLPRPPPARGRTKRAGPTGPGAERRAGSGGASHDGRA